jgi:hypothetical protein
MSYDFGKSITRTLYPLENDLPIDLPTQNPTIDLFSSQPSLADALAGTGKVRTSVATWTESHTSPYARTYAHDPINDPDTSSNVPCRGYWEAIKFVISGGGQTQMVLRQFEVERTQAQSILPSVLKADLVLIFPGLSTYAGDTDITGFITLATDWVKTEIEGMGVDWGKFPDLSKLKQPICYKALQMFAESQMKRNPEFEKIAERNLGDYNFLMKQIKLKYDSDGDGATDSTNQPKRGAIIQIR